MVAQADLKLLSALAAFDGESKGSVLAVWREVIRAPFRQCEESSPGLRPLGDPDTKRRKVAVLHRLVEGQYAILVLKTVPGGISSPRGDLPLKERHVGKVAPSLGRLLRGSCLRVCDVADGESGEKKESRRSAAVTEAAVHHILSLGAPAGKGALLSNPT
jgi:hypothetical protein